MLKILLKKQFLELNTFYFTDRKTGKRRSKGKTAAMIAVFSLLFIFLGFAFFGVASVLAEAFVPMGLTWLLFAIMGILSMLLGIFGSVFNTYASLYKGKDNDLLLSLPIKPRDILIARMTGVYALSLLYEAIIYVPTLIAYFIYGDPNGLSVVNSVLLMFIITFLILALTCLLGWVVAAVSSKLKNKSFVTVILSLALFGVYYWFCMNSSSMLEDVVLNSARISATIKKVYPAYLFGKAAEGQILPMLLVTLGIAVIFALTCYVMSKSYIKIATSRSTAVKTVYKEKTAKMSKAETALLGKEWKRFTQSPTYMLNCALATVLMLIGAVAALIFTDKIRTALLMIPISADMLAFFAAVVVCFVAAMNDLTAPSVSLEGKTIWILQSLPVDIKKVLNAKIRLHLWLTLPPAFVLTICAAIVIKAKPYDVILMFLMIEEFITLTANAGLAINLKKPDLTWTNETMALKQSIGVLITLFGSVIAAGLLGVIGYALSNTNIGGSVLMVLAAVLLRAINTILGRWLKNKGTEIFASL